MTLFSTRFRLALGSLACVLAIGLTVVFFAIPANRYDWMRDMGESELPADPDGLLRLGLGFVPAALAWGLAAVAFRSSGRNKAAVVATTCLALLAVAAVYRLL